MESVIEMLMERVHQTETKSDPDPIHQIYPPEWREPYGGRRKKLGIDLYGLLGISRGETDKMHAQIARNYRFFDAPVGLIFTIERVMAEAQLLDCGMFMQNIMLAARARGLDTCPQAAFLHFHKLIGDKLGFPEDELLVCGMSLGYADANAPENSLTSERADLADFVKFHV